MLAQFLEVLDDVPGRVLPNITVRCTATCATLVDEHESVMLRVEKTAIVRRDANARPTVQKQSRSPVRVAHFFVDDRVQVGNGQFADAVGFDGRVEWRWYFFSHCFLDSA